MLPGSEQPPISTRESRTGQITFIVFMLASLQTDMDIEANLELKPSTVWVVGIGHVFR